MCRLVAQEYLECSANIGSKSAGRRGIAQRIATPSFHNELLQCRDKVRGKPGIVHFQPLRLRACNVFVKED